MAIYCSLLAVAAILNVTDSKIKSADGCPMIMFSYDCVIKFVLRLMKHVAAVQTNTTGNPPPLPLASDDKSSRAEEKSMKSGLTQRRFQLNESH